jgi:cytochrome c556
MNGKKNTLSICMVYLITAWAMSSHAQASKEGDVARAIEYRQSIMTLFNWNMRPMGAMMKQKVPFNQTAFVRHAKDLEAAAQLDLLAGFPEDSEGDDSDALPDIWLDFEDFKKKYQDLQLAADKLAEVAESGDQATIKPAFQALGKTCKACHQAYKD